MSKQGGSQGGSGSAGGAQDSPKLLVLCPECDEEVNLAEVDECPKCGLNVQRVYDQARYRRALRKVEDAHEASGTPAKKKKKAGDWNPFE